RDTVRPRQAVVPAFSGPGTGKNSGMHRGTAFCTPAHRRFARPCTILHGIKCRQESIMKWAGMYFFGFVLLIGGGLAALWKLGILQNIETTWIVIGVVILVGLGIMF